MSTIILWQEKDNQLTENKSRSFPGITILHQFYKSVESKQKNNF